LLLQQREVFSAQMKSEGPASKSIRQRRRRSASESHPLSEENAGRADDKLARREAPSGQNLLARILNTPQLAQVVPRLQPKLLHQVIQSCGLEDCGELLALATPEQLARVFDLDLWRAARPGLDEQFNADRFGVWLEVLMEYGATVAAQKLSEIDPDLVIAGLAQHAQIYDCAAVAPYETTDGELIDGIRVVDDGVTYEIGGYLMVAKSTDSWEAIVAILMSLDERYPDYFHQVMQGCRALSDSMPEIDGLDDLLLNGDQAMFDLAVDRERRQEKQGYVPPAQARAFFQMSRQLRLRGDAVPPVNPVARAYFRALDETTATDARSAPGRLAAGSESPTASEDPAESVAALFDLLIEAGILAQPPRALLTGSEAETPRLLRIRRHMQFILDCDQAAYSAREKELAYLANTLISGCSFQARRFSVQEASDAAIAVCNLGLENWPPHWLPEKTTALPDSFLVNHDLISVFQVGWRVLYVEVGMYAAEELIRVLANLRCNDREIQMGLDSLRIEMARQWQAGTPWRARDALDVIAILDMPVWAALLALIDECPTLHACAAVLRDPKILSVNASDFEFISKNGQIASVREFMRLLPEMLR
jgi:uncharacterized protein DUF6178